MVYDLPVKDIIDDGWRKRAEGEGRTYPLPFVNDAGDYDDDDVLGGADMPRTLIEGKMNALSSILREKPEWVRKSRDPGIVAKWREEALKQQDGLHEEEQLTTLMVDYVLAELAGYAKLYDVHTGIQMGCFERIWRSDSLISSSIRESLLKYVERLEAVSEEEKDWHPKSNQQVLDLVHPALYPLVYGRTLIYENEGKGKLLSTAPPKKDDNDDFTSIKYQWLPADFTVESSGEAHLTSPYINNLDRRQHPNLYKIVERIVGAAVPMWNHVLSDLRRPLTPHRVQTSSVENNMYSCRYQGISCIWGSNGPPYSEDEPDTDEWMRKQPKILPRGLEKYNGALDAIQQTVDLKDTNIQVIVKLANIILTPENPEYAGGSWHVEGMKNESIVSTFIYYYDEANVTESRLAFRTATREPSYHHQDDSTCMQILYGLDRGDICIQDRGEVITKEGRCIAFPNIYQHQVQPFGLQDKSKPGHRKILALFLIDPTNRIVSTTDVPPQRREQYTDLLLCSPVVQNLPAELRMILCGEVQEGVTRQEAEAFRLDLMEERSAATKYMDDEDHARYGHTRYGHTFNMCEH